MARKRMVTRTIVTTNVKVLCVNVKTSEVETKTFTLGANDGTEEKKILKRVQELLDPDVKAVTITEFTEKEELYGMTEELFIRFAKALDPTTRKILESDVDTDVDAEDEQEEAEEN